MFGKLLLGLPLLAILGTVLYFTLSYSYYHLYDSNIFIKIFSWFWLIYGSIGGAIAIGSVIIHIFQ